MNEKETLGGQPLHGPGGGNGWAFMKEKPHTCSPHNGYCASGHTKSAVGVNGDRHSNGANGSAKTTYETISENVERIGRKTLAQTDKDLLEFYAGDTKTGDWEADFVERGADLEHARWSRWQAYLHSKCVEHENGKGEWVCFPADSFRHWQRQIDTPYANLSEKEKESDRNEVREYLPLIRETHQQLLNELIAEVEKIKINQNHWCCGNKVEVEFSDLKSLLEDKRDSYGKN